MWLLSQIHLLALFSYLAISAWVLLKSPRERLNHSCALFAACLAVWSLEKVGHGKPGIDLEEAWFWSTICDVGWIALPSAFLWFVQVLTGRMHKPWDRRLLRLTIVVGAVLMVAQLRHLIVSELVRMPYGWTYRWADGPWPYVFFAYYVLIAVIGSAMLLNYMRQPTDAPFKRQARLFFIFTPIGLTLATFTDTVAPLLEWHAIPPIGNLLFLFWVAGLSYSIVRHRFLTISPASAAENIITAMSDLLILTDTAGRIVRVNRAAEECLEVDRHSMEGRRLTDIVTIDDPDHSASRFHLQDAPPTENKRLMLKLRTGRCIPVLLSSSRLMDGNQMAGKIILIKDISRLMNAQEEKKALMVRLAQAEKMEAIGTLAGAVAHDLNNVLSGIVSYPELMLLDMPRDSRLREMVEIIRASGEKAAAIVQDLLTLARRGVLTFELVDINQIVKEYLVSPEYLKLRSLYPNIKIEVKLADDLACIMGSGVHLTKSLMNLLTNAFEAIPPQGGRITLTTANNILEYYPVLEDESKSEFRSFVVLTITDTGSGIAFEDQERIFEPFFTRKKMGRSGTGLGMAVVWGTVQDHNGRIDLESRPGRGTTFSLYFPAVAGKRESAPVAASLDVYAGRGESILVVDDVADQRRIASDILKRLGYKVHAVSSGEKAIEFLEGQEVDLVILDMHMEPGMDGLETFIRLSGIRPAQKVIIASGYSETERIQAALGQGVLTCLKKPYSVKEIGACVRAVLSGEMAN